MTKLEKLYSIIENSREVGVKLNEDVLLQVEELEESIIKEEILPALGKDIAPRLEPIKRDLVLVVEYHPGEPLSVALSRKAKISEIMGAKTLIPRVSNPTKNYEKPEGVRIPTKVVAGKVSEPKPVIIKSTSYKTAENIMKEEYDKEKRVVCEGSVCSSFPMLVMKYLMYNDNKVYNTIVRSFSMHYANQGQQIRTYRYIYKNIEIPRFFLPKNNHSSLSEENKRRWKSDVEFPINGHKCYISNQWVGHDIEAKNNLRINDFAYMIYKLSGQKYYINFIPSDNKYIMQLVQIKK